MTPKARLTQQRQGKGGIIIPVKVPCMRDESQAGQTTYQSGVPDFDDPSLYAIIPSSSIGLG